MLCSDLVALQHVIIDLDLLFDVLIWVAFVALIIEEKKVREGPNSIMLVRKMPTHS